MELGVFQISDDTIKYLRKQLIHWGRENFCCFPWRDETNQLHALLAEILLQRTNAEQVVNTYLKLVEKLIPEFQAQLQVGHINVTAALTLCKLSEGEQRELLSEKKVTSKIATEKLREKDSNQIPLIDVPDENPVKPGLFLSSQQVEELLNGEVVNIEYEGQKLGIILNVKEGW